MESHELLLIFCIAFFIFQMSTKLAIDCENNADFGSPFYCLNVSIALSSIFVGSYSLISWSQKAEKSLKKVDEHGKTESNNAET